MNDLNDIWLGVKRVFGSLTSEKTQELSIKILSDFTLDLDRDIVACVCDGASVNQKFLRETDNEAQVCMAHDVHY